MNKFGQSLIDLCRTHSVHILNGKVNGDVDDNCTCFSNDGKSIVDYIIVSSDLFENVKCSYVENIEFSDHFPIVRHLKFENIVNSNIIADEHCKNAERFEQYK